MRLLKIITSVAILLTGLGVSNAAPVSISASAIPSSGPSSFTTSDGQLTLTPTDGGSTASIGGGGSGCCFGVGNDQVNDDDGNPATLADQEAMAIGLAPQAYLNSLSFIFTRATTQLPAGPAEDGIRISGFAADPGVSYYSEEDPVGTLNNVSGVEGVSFSGDTLNIDHAWRGGAVTVFEFANLSATLGRTLTLTVADQDEPNPQANFRTVTYSVVPEPGASLSLGALASAFFAISRRRA